MQHPRNSGLHRLALAAAVTAIVATYPGSSLLAQSPSELRGVWITNVASTVMYSDAAIAEAMDYLSSAGFNVVFPVVWNDGYTIYPSEVMQKMFGTPIHPSFAGRDPLDRIIIEAHRNGIEVIPWFEYGFATKYATDSTEIGPILTAHPDWILRDSQGRIAVKNGTYPQFVWMSGINPGVQDFMLSLVTEVVDRYDVDGVQGDDRLPAMPVEGGYEESTRAQYAAEHAGAMPPGDFRNADWMRWRADKLNAFLERLRDSVKIRSASLIVSSGPSEYAWGYPEYLQDSKTWVDSSIVDNFIPQLYPSDRGTPQSTIDDYTFRLDRALSYVAAPQRPVFFAGMLAQVGSYTIEPTTATTLVALNRARGVEGETWFFYEGLRTNSNALGDALKSGPYAAHALLPYRNGVQYRFPAGIINETDPGAAVNGSWLRFNVPGYNGFALVTFDTGAVKSVTYTGTVPEAGVYDIFTYRISAPSVARTTSAPFALIGADGDTTVFVDQGGSQASGWVRLGSVPLQEGIHPIVRLTNEGIGSGKTVIADAIMFLTNRQKSAGQSVSVRETHDEGEVPRDVLLKGNFPNPFNPSTTILYELPETMQVRLEVFNVLGQTVAVVANGEQGAGVHNAYWDAHVASGVYFSRLVASSITDPRSVVTRTRPMVLAR